MQLLFIRRRGLNTKNVICIDALLRDDEDLNIAYVAITRAEDNLLVANFQQIYRLVEVGLKNLILTFYCKYDIFII